MSSTTDETTVELKTENGSSGPMPMSEFQQRADGAIERLRNEQLSFDVGTLGIKARPDFASLKVSGDLPINRDLDRKQVLRITVSTKDGEVLIETLGAVTGVGFKDKTDKYGTTTERVHTVTLA